MSIIIIFIFSLLSQNSSKNTYYLTNGYILDINSGEYKKSNILIKDDKIIETSNTLIEGIRQIDISNKFVIPGLWDMHTHVTYQRKESLPLYITKGITGLRDLGGNFTYEQEVKNDIKNGKIIAPTILFSSPILESDNWLKWASKNYRSELGENRIGVRDSLHAVQIVDSLKQLDINHIKFRNVQDRKTYYSLIRAAENVGINIYGHSQFFKAHFSNASQLGQDSFEHAMFFSLDGMTKEKRIEVYETMAKNNSYIDPTFITNSQHRLRTYTDQVQMLNNFKRSDIYETVHPEIFSMWEEQIYSVFLESYMDWKSNITRFRSYAKEMIQHGVKFVSGSDLAMFLDPSESLHHELQEMVRITGMSNLEALKTATLYPTELMKINHEYGKINKNYYANILILNENPLSDIKNTRSIYSVINKGKYYSKSSLIDIQSSVRSSFKEILLTFKPQKNIVQEKRINSRIKLMKKILGKEITDANFEINLKKFLRSITMYSVLESDINKLAYNIIVDGYTKEGELLFKFNIEKFPTSWNAYDSLAEFYLKTDRIKLAKQFYVKAMELNPQKTKFQKNQFKFQKSIVNL